jgi:hypothetical protein
MAWLLLVLFKIHLANLTPPVSITHHGGHEAGRGDPGQAAAIFRCVPKDRGWCVTAALK